MGGQDQWGNIVAGIDFIRRKLSMQAFGITFPLITDSEGNKYGKTVDGAVWLDRDMLEPYEYYQFWRNVDDADVGKLMKFYTFLPLDEIKRLAGLERRLLNRAKEILAYEAVKITHGKEDAEKAYSASIRQFGPADPDNSVETSSDITGVTDTGSDIPSVTLSKDELQKGYWVVKLFNDAGLVSSNGEARRLITQGGLYVQEERVEQVELNVDESFLKDGEILLRTGKKNYRKVIFE
jgi:tyrosyl-tRNA synthetase